MDPLKIRARIMEESEDGQRAKLEIEINGNRARDLAGVIGRSTVEIFKGCNSCENRTKCMSTRDAWSSGEEFKKKLDVLLQIIGHMNQPNVAGIAVAIIVRDEDGTESRREMNLGNPRWN